MPYIYDLPNNSSGIDKIILDVFTEVPALSPLLFLFVWAVVFFGGTSREKIRTGTAQHSLWSVVASICTFMLALVLSVSTGYIRLDWLVIAVTITILSGVWYFLDRDKAGI